MMGARQFVPRAGAALAVLTLAALGAAPAADAGVSHALAFGTPDTNVNCGVIAAPPTIPKKSLLCTAPGGYIALQPTGSAKAIVWKKPFSPLGGQPGVVLAAGTHWSWQSIKCTISWWTISCSNGQGKLTVGKAPATPNTVPLLGSGGPPAVGFGKVKPAEVYFGGDPTGMFKSMSWSQWGYAETIGKGSGYYNPPNEPTAAAKPTPVILTASSLGVCHGKLAYRELAVTFVYKGHDEPGTKESICS